MLEKQLPHDGYINAKVDPMEQKTQWIAHLLTLHGSLAEGDVRKGEITIQDFLRKYRWFTEYGKAYNLKEFRLNLPTTHASDLCEYASYQAYITGTTMRRHTRSSCLVQMPAPFRQTSPSYPARKPPASTPFAGPNGRTPSERPCGIQVSKLRLQTRQRGHCHPTRSG